MEEDVKALISNIENNSLNDMNPIEKVRWIYIKFGDIFSYNNLLGNNEVHLNSDHINKYQNSIQIGQILNELLNKIDPSIKSMLVKISNDTSKDDYANIVNINNERYLINLTSDLYRIQTGLKTKWFASPDNKYNSLSYISLSDLDSIDKKLKLYKYGYTEDRIDELKRQLSLRDFSNSSFEEEVDFRIDVACVLLPNNISYFEGDNFISNNIVNNFLVGNIDKCVLELNKERKSVYIIHKNDDIIYYIYDNNGFNKARVSLIEDLMSNGWINKSGKLRELIDSQNINKENR